MSKPILFCDFNGVISYNTFWQSLEPADHPLHQYYAPVRSIFLDESRNIAKDWMLGKYTAEEVHRLLASETGINYDSLWNIFKSECEEIDISQAILDKIRTLGSSYTTILSTGNMDSFERFTLAKNSQLSHTFDRIDNSYNLGLFKTTNNGQYFSDTSRALGADIQRCIVLDDSKKVCKVFESLGGRAFCVNTENQVLQALNTLL